MGGVWSGGAIANKLLYTWTSAGICCLYPHWVPSPVPLDSPRRRKVKSFARELACVEKVAQEAARGNVSLGLLTDEVPQGDGATARLLRRHPAGGAAGRLLPLPMVGARIHAPRQNAPQRGDVSGRGRGVRGGGPATKGRRPREVAKAVAPLGRRAYLSEAGPREGGTGAGVRHWY